MPDTHTWRTNFINSSAAHYIFRFQFFLPPCTSLAYFFFLSIRSQISLSRNFTVSQSVFNVWNVIGSAQINVFYKPAAFLFHEWFMVLGNQCNNLHVFFAEHLRETLFGIPSVFRFKLLSHRRPADPDRLQLMTFRTWFCVKWFDSPSLTIGKPISIGHGILGIVHCLRDHCKRVIVRLELAWWEIFGNYTTVLPPF